MVYSTGKTPGEVFNKIVSNNENISRLMLENFMCFLALGSPWALLK